MGLLTTIATFKANKCMDEEFGSLFLRNLPSGEFSADETNAKASLKYALRIFELGRRLISLSSILKFDFVEMIDFFLKNEINFNGIWLL